MSDRSYGDLGCIQRVSGEIMSYVAYGSMIMGLIQRLHIIKTNKNEEFTEEELFEKANEMIEEVLIENEKSIIERIAEKVKEVYTDAIDNISGNMKKYIDYENSRGISMGDHKEVADNYLDLLKARAPGYDMTVIVYDNVKGWDKHGYYGSMSQEWFRSKIRGRERNLIVNMAKSIVIEDKEEEKTEVDGEKLLEELKNGEKTLADILKMAGENMVKNMKDFDSETLTGVITDSGINFPKYMTENRTGKWFLWVGKDNINIGLASNNIKRIKDIILSQKTVISNPVGYGPSTGIDPIEVGRFRVLSIEN